MTPDEQNPFDGISEEDGDDAVWVTVAALVALFVLVLWCWVVAA